MAYLNQGFDSNGKENRSNEIRLPRVKRGKNVSSLIATDSFNYQLPDGSGTYLKTASEFYPNNMGRQQKSVNHSIPQPPPIPLENADAEEFNPDEDYSLLSFFRKKKPKGLGNDVGHAEKENGKKSSLPGKIMATFVTVLYIAYFVYVIMVQSKIEHDDYWCRGDGLLIVLTSMVATGVFYFWVVKPIFRKLFSRCASPVAKFFSKCLSNWFSRLLIFGAIIGGIAAFLYFDTIGERYRLKSLIGIAFLLSCGFLFSAAPRKVRWRHTLWAMGLQFSLAMMLLRWPTGRVIFECISNKVALFLSFTDKGSSFVFGDLATTMSIFAFQVLPVTLYFSFITNILFYFGIVQWVVIKLGWLLQVTAGTTLCESVNAAANVFLGMTEAPLLIKPYLPQMTKSEIHAVMTGGFATIAGAVMAAFISFGVSPSNLLTACIMNAPASLGMAKLFYPETEKTKIDEGTINSIKSEEINVLHAACVGVSNALPLVANIAGNLIAFIAFLELTNSLLDWGCQLADFDAGVCSLEGIFGYVFMPFAYLLGVQWSECYNVGQLIGLKIIINEFVAYGKLSEFKKAAILSPRAEALSTFALCGFSNISAIGIMMGGLSSLAPSRKSDMATVVVRAMIAGSMATFMSTCIAGVLLSDNQVIPMSNMTDSIIAAVNATHDVLV